MSCEQLKGSLPEFWDGSLPLEERRALEAHFASCDDCRREALDLREAWQAMEALPDEEPSPMLRQRFDAMLEGWQVRDLPVRPMPTRVVAPQPRTRDARWWQTPSVWSGALAAAAVLLVFGLIGAGFVLGRSASSTDASAAAARVELAELRNEMHGMRQMVAISLLHQDSVTERLRGVSWSNQLDAPDAEIVNTLVDTLTHDSNVNVRLAAIDALRQFAQTTPDGQNKQLRAALVQSIATQSSPLVQISLIDTMVQLRERDAVTVLRTLADDATANKAVRQRATWGVRQLS
jgi:hypothetical protein